MSVDRHDRDDDHDPVLDALLDEVVGGQSPPDLTQRILAAWQAKSAASTPGAAAGAARQALTVDGRPDITTEVLAGQCPNCQPSAHQAPRPRIVVNAADGRAARHHVRTGRGTGGPQVTGGDSDSAHHVPWWAVVASLLLMVGAGVSLGIVALNMSRPHADSGSSLAGTAQPAGQSPPRPSAAQRQLPANSSQAPQIVQSSPGAANRQPRTNAPDDMQPSLVTVPANEPDSVAITPDVPAATMSPSDIADPLNATQLVSYVDRSLQQLWADKKVKPSDFATDEEWCRRAFVRLIGRIPTVDELEAFVADPSAKKHARLVERLQQSDAYATEFARNWATVWTNALIGRTAGTQPSDAASREHLLQYLQSAWLADRPLNEVVYELLAARGTGQPGGEDFNAAANFLLAHHTPDAVSTTGVVSRVFLGQRISCAQCHDHPSNAWDQQKFWQLNAFFRQMGIQRDAQQRARLVSQDAKEAEVYFEQMNGYTRVAYPVLPDGQALDAAPEVAKVDRREAIARWIAGSEELPRAVVNRVWAHFFGYGFTQPIDDMGPHNPPVNPELLEQLAGQFVAHGYSLRELTSWIALSDAFRRSSKVSENNLADAPERGDPPLFSRYYTRRMQPEAVFDSLRLVAEARNAGELKDPQARVRWLAQFAGFPDDGDASMRASGDTGQPIPLMHDSLMHRAVDRAQGAVLREVVQAEMPLSDKIEHLFLAAVARKPSANELQLVEKMIRQAERPEVGLEDIWWALLNSNEFVLDH